MCKISADFYWFNFSHFGITAGARVCESCFQPVHCLHFSRLCQMMDRWILAGTSGDIRTCHTLPLSVFCNRENGGRNLTFAAFGSNRSSRCHKLCLSAWHKLFFLSGSDPQVVFKHWILSHTVLLTKLFRTPRRTPISFQLSRSSCRMQNSLLIDCKARLTQRLTNQFCFACLVKGQAKFSFLQIYINCTEQKGLSS